MKRRHNINRSPAFQAALRPVSKAAEKEYGGNMFFIVLAVDRPGALELRLAHRQKHIDYWNSFPGTVRIGGALLADDSIDAPAKGSGFIIEAENSELVRGLLARDPFVLEGVFGDDIRIDVMRLGIGDWKPG